MGDCVSGAVGPREEEFFPSPELTAQVAVAAYRDRAAATNAVVRSTFFDTPCQLQAGTTLRWVLLLHLINEPPATSGTPMRPGSSSTGEPERDWAPPESSFR